MTNGLFCAAGWFLCHADLFTWATGFLPGSSLSSRCPSEGGGASPSSGDVSFQAQKGRGVRPLLLFLCWEPDAAAGAAALRFPDFRTRPCPGTEALEPGSAWGHLPNSRLPARRVPWVLVSRRPRSVLSSRPLGKTKELPVLAGQRPPARPWAQVAGHLVAGPPPVVGPGRGLSSQRLALDHPAAWGPGGTALPATAGRLVTPSPVRALLSSGPGSMANEANRCTELERTDYLCSFYANQTPNVSVFVLVVRCLGRLGPAWGTLRLERHWRLRVAARGPEVHTACSSPCSRARARRDPPAKGGRPGHSRARRWLHGARRAAEGPACAVPGLRRVSCVTGQITSMFVLQLLTPGKRGREQ